MSRTRVHDGPGGPRRSAPWVPVSAALGWVGLLVHNVADLPGQTIVSPESVIPLALTVVLVAAWFTRLRSVAAWALLGWGVLNLLGAILTVLPLPILPFDPAQTPAHYAFHLLYGITQVPLVVTTAIWLRRRI
ncbi:hypothetical protein NQ152_04105 [Microbacterium sp. zg.B48]|uniref:hypothetical protein n=1 Tax=Microbacterium sp. zg.B48 TaxID=2969408 RepID=UPI00214CF554|nr:hypothetical protein [Microbacterium sp. zg.B48]MCR2762688.1 hypothetical protein [Microbacterium sp. zg.B48]